MLCLGTVSATRKKEGGDRIDGLGEARSSNA